MIKRIHSIWRVILFPFYSAYEVAAFIFVECALGLASILILGSLKLGTLFAGYLGWMMVAASTTPSTTTLERESRRDVESALKSLRYRYESAEQRWLPNVPRLLVWRYNHVRLEEDGGKLRLFGPRNILEEIVDRASELR